MLVTGWVTAFGEENLGEEIEGKVWRIYHIVSCGKFHRIGGAPLETFPNVKYDAPEEVGGDRKCLDSPIRK